MWSLPAHVAYPHSRRVDSRVVGTVAISLRAFEWHDGDARRVSAPTRSKSADFYRRAAVTALLDHLANGDLHASVIAKKVVRRFGVRARTAVANRLWAASRGTSTGPSVLGNMRTLCRRGRTC